MVTRYRDVLALPGMAALLGVSLLARAAITADVLALTMYVVLGLGMSYAAAGGVAAGRFGSRRRASAAKQGLKTVSRAPSSLLPF